MPILLPPMSHTMELGPPRSTLGTAAVALTAAPVPYRVDRDAVKASLDRRRYRHVMDRRLRHIPLELPYPAPQILARLKERDEDPTDRRRQEALLEVETRLTLLSEPWASRLSHGKAPEDRKVRRLERIWETVGLTADRLKLIASHRQARLSYNVSLFFESDLPGPYLAEMEASTHWEIAGLFLAFNAEAQKLFHRVTGGPGEEAAKHDFLASTSSLHEIEAAFRVFDKRLSTVSAATDSVLEWRDALEYFVDLFSAGTLQEFRTLRRISLSSLDRTAFEEMSEGLREVTYKLRGLLAREYPGGVASYQWISGEDPFLSDLLRTELAEA